MPKKSLHTRAAGVGRAAATPKRSTRGKAREGTIAKKRTIRSRKKAPGFGGFKAPQKTVTKKRAPKAPGTKAPKSGAAAPRRPLRLFVDADELPLRYDSTRLALIARDPHWIYAYWEINPRTQIAVRRKIGPAFKNASYVLRLHDITESGFKGPVKGRYFDVPVEPPKQSKYIELAGDNATYCAELFIRSHSGKYFLLAQSNSVSTPNAGACESTEQTWITVKQGEGVAPQILQTIQESPRTQPPAQAPEQGFESTAAAARPTEPPPLSSQQADKLPAKPETSRRSRSEVLPYESISPSGPGAVYGEKLRGAPEAPPLGSSDLAHNRGDFPFAIETELVVRGRTAARSRVWFNSDRIPVTLDGTFFLHFDLPDGETPLQFTALSPNATKTKTITTSVVRSPTISQ